MSKRPRVVVIGGGIAGCAVAMELAAGAASVTLVERDQPGVGATGASAGMLAPQYETHPGDPTFTFAVACREAFPAFVEGVEALTDWGVGFNTDGMLVANWRREEEDAARRDLAFHAEVGLPGEILPVEEARKIHPGVSAAARSWLWLPREAQVDSQRLAAGLADAVQAAGARLVRGQEVTEVRSRSGRVEGVRLSDGAPMEADHVVVAAGAWGAKTQGLPRPLPVRPVRGQILRLLPPEPLPWTLVCNHEGRYLVPRVNGSILMGSTMEDVGYDERVTEEGQEILAEAAAAMIPALEEATIAEVWAGLRPISADNLPILGPDPEMEGLHYATGYGRNGILFGPLAGRAVAELILGGGTAVKWEPFQIGRFPLGPVRSPPTSPSSDERPAASSPD